MCPLPFFPVPLMQPYKTIVRRSQALKMQSEGHYLFHPLTFDQMAQTFAFGGQTANPPVNPATLAQTALMVSAADKIGKVSEHFDANNPNQILSAEPRQGVPAFMEVNKVYQILLNLNQPLDMRWRKAASVNPDTGQNWEWLSANCFIDINGETHSTVVDGWQLMGLVAQIASTGQNPVVFAKVGSVPPKQAGRNPIKTIELFSVESCDADKRITINAEAYKASKNVEPKGF